MPVWIWLRTKFDISERLYVTSLDKSNMCKLSSYMPDYLHFRFKMASNDMEVRLRRSDLSSHGRRHAGNILPLFVIENGTIKKETIPDMLMKVSATIINHFDWLMVCLLFALLQHIVCFYNDIS